MANLLENKGTLPINTIKGILIVAIIIGHNRIIANNIPFLFPILYFWHVQGFFFVAASTRLDGNRSISISTALTRYMVPFCIFVVAIWLVRSGARSSFDMGGLSRALVFGSADGLNEATDLSLLWFLPCFAVFIIIFQFLSKINLVRHNLIAVSVILVLIIPLLLSAFPIEYMNLVPLNAGLAVYIIPGALMFSIIYRFIQISNKIKLAILSLSALIVIIQISLIVYYKTRINISVFQFGDNELEIYIAILSSVAMNIIVTEFARVVRNVKILNIIGEQSMYIFLIHQFIQSPMSMIINRLCGEGSTLSVIVSIAAVPLVVLISLVLKSILFRYPAVSSIIFPKDYPSFKASLGLK